MNLILIVLLSLASSFAAVGQILFKMGASGATKFTEFVNTKIVMGLLCYGISTVFWIYCLSKTQLVNIYVFTVLTFVLVYLMAYCVLGERINVYGIMGVLLVLCGLYLVAVKGAS